MILPNKHLKQDRSLIGIGSDILAALAEDRTVSELWENVRIARDDSVTPISFDWFILSLSFLYTIGAINFSRNIVSKRRDR